MLTLDLNILKFQKTCTEREDKQPNIKYYQIFPQKGQQSFAVVLLEEIGPFLRGIWARLIDVETSANL